MADLDSPTAVASTSEPEHDIRRSLTAIERRWLISIIGVAAAARIAWYVYAKADPPTFWRESGDQFSYWYYGNEISHGRWYSRHFLFGGPTAYYPVGFPTILGTLFFLSSPVTDNRMLVAGLFQLVVSVATVWLTFVIARRLLGIRAGLVAAVMMSIFPNVIYQVVGVQVETTFIFLVMAALAIIVDHDWTHGAPSRTRLLAFGVVLGLSALVRPFSTPLLLGVLTAGLLAGLGWRRALQTAGIPFVVVVVMFIPWTVRNAIVLDSFIPSSTNMGDTLCLDRSTDATGGFRWALPPACVDDRIDEVRRNQENTKKAISWVFHHPTREMLQIVRRARLMFGSDFDGIVAAETLGSDPVWSESTRRVLVDIGNWYFAGLLLLTVPGLVLIALRSRRPERTLVLTAFGFLTAIPILLWGNPRFHLPLTPFMALAAAAVVSFLLDRGRPAARD